METKPTKHKQTIHKPKIFLKLNISRLKKQGPVRFQLTTFAVPGVFVTSRPSVPETQVNFNLLSTEPKFTISNVDHSVNKIIYGKKA